LEQDEKQATKEGPFQKDQTSAIAQIGQENAKRITTPHRKGKRNKAHNLQARATTTRSQAIEGGRAKKGNKERREGEEFRTSHGGACAG
jgi:hypothetical protein